MRSKSPHSRFWIGVPPWIFIGAVIILLPLFTFVTLENINRQKKQSRRLLLEKGAALIRSFEAGTRTGMMGIAWSSRQLQQLLYETAQQPDIAYLLVAAKDGRVLAHGDPEQVGTVHGRKLDLAAIGQAEHLHWRIRSDPGGQEIFEIFRRFSPSGGMMGMHRGQRRMMQQFKRHLEMMDQEAFAPAVIFVGLDMKSVEAARAADMRHSLIMGAGLLLVGFAGVILLFLVQSYRATRASLSRIKAFSDNLLENMPIGVLAVDPGDTIVSFNPTAGQILGLEPQASLGRPAQPLLPPPLLEQLQTADQDVGRIGRELECPLDGSDRGIPLEVSTSQVTDDNGVSLGRVLLFKDLTEVRALKREIARSQRLVSVGRLAAGVAHEIRNPLSSIKGFATYFKERYPDVPEDQQIANIMIQEVDRLNRVVGQLLEFARPVTVSKKMTALDGLIQDSLKMVEQQARKARISIETDFGSGICPVLLDPDKMNQVLLNLFLNALEAMENGGTLRVTLKNSVSRDHQETSGHHDSAGTVFIQITDSGAGISKADLAHVFDPYFTTKATGTGLGLAIVHNILEAHGGEIRLESRPAHGTTVTLLLPCHTREDARTKLQATPSEERP